MLDPLRVTKMMAIASCDQGYMGLFGRALAPAPKLASSGALPNDVLGDGSNHGAPWSP